MSTIDTFLAGVRAEARSLDPLKVVLTIVAAPFFVVGWLLGQAARLLLVLVAFAWSAAVVGYRTARPPSGDGS